VLYNGQPRFGCETDLNAKSASPFQSNVMRPSICIGLFPGKGLPNQLGPAGFSIAEFLRQYSIPVLETQFTPTRQFSFPQSTIPIAHLLLDLLSVFQVVGVRFFWCPCHDCNIGWGVFARERTLKPEDRCIRWTRAAA
jgi:hypothetical protein